MTDYMVQYRRNLKAMNNAGKGTPQAGEIWWVSNLDGIKDRPVLILGHQGSTFMFRKCTSQYSTAHPRDTIEDYYDAGLDKATYVDPNVRTIPRSQLVRRMGRLSDLDCDKFGL